MDATALIRAHINSTLDGVAADHLLTHVPISELCAALAAILQSDDEGAIRDACLVIRDGALMAPPPGRAVFRAALHEYGIIEFVEGNLFADDHFIRDTAVYTLGKIGATESLPALRLAFTLYRDTDPLLVPGIIFESAWLGEDKWTLIDSALNSPVYVTRWSTIYELSRSADDLSYKEKQLVRLEGLAKDESALVRGEAVYTYSVLTAAISHELPRSERKRRRQEVERHKPTITFADCEIRFGNHLIVPCRARHLDRHAVGTIHCVWTARMVEWRVEVRYRLLGRSGLRVSQVFLGAMTFGEGGGPGAPPEECRRMLDAYAEAGGNVVDTAINYRNGESEQIVGELLEGRRDRFVLATKYTVSRDGSDPNAAGNHRKNLLHSLETSLRRLRTDYIDLYWVHIWDRHTPIDETMRALDDAVRAGKVLYVGISDTPAWVVSRANTLAEWRGWTPFVGLQVPYNLLNRDIERELLPMAEAYGMSVAVWGPLASGVLSGKFTRSTGTTAGTRVSASSVSERDHAVARAVQDVAAEMGVTPAQVAIAWTMAHSPAVHPILGARRLDQLVDNLGALDIVLPADAVARLEAAAGFTAGFPHDFIAGTARWVFGEAGGLVDGRDNPPPLYG